MTNVLSASQFHPQVDHYRDGGMGGIGENHSVVGMVPTHVLQSYREHDGRWSHLNNTDSAHDDQVIEGLRSDLRAGKGFHTPLMLEYNHQQGRAYLGEGNHRLAAAVAEGVPEVPLRVVRSYKDMSNVGAPASHREIPGAPKDYIPSDIHPSYLSLAQHKNRGTQTEQIMDLLGPARR